MTLFAVSAFHSVTAGVARECKVRFLSFVILTFDLDIQIIWARDQIHLFCEFGANPFSGFRDIWFTNKKTMKTSQTASAENRTLLACGNCAKATLFTYLHGIPHCRDRVEFWPGGWYPRLNHRRQIFINLAGRARINVSTIPCYIVTNGRQLLFLNKNAHRSDLYYRYDGLWASEM